MTRAEAAGTNWAGNYAYRAAELRTPGSLEELRDLVRTAPRLRVLGSRHSFNDVADTDGTLVSLAELGSDIDIDSAARTVSAPGGIRYGELARHLDERGWALHNLASLPHISVAGAVATGTHGSGDRNGTLATAVRALELITSSGEIVRTQRGEPGFDGTVVSLGLLGVVSRIELEIEPAFAIAQRAFLNFSWDTIDENIDALLASAYSVSLFTDWSDRGVQQVWQKHRVGRTAIEELPDTLLGAPAAAQRMHPIAGIDAVNCTEQGGVPGPWFDRLPHFRMDFTPSNGEEIQSEYLVPRESARDAIAAIRRLSSRVTPLIQVAEIRSMRGDELWLSGASGRDTVGLHFTWVREEAAVRSVLPLIEEALAPFDARPHWGKVFLGDATELERLYPRLPEFRALADRLDPRGAFRNAFSDRYLFGGR